MTHLEKLRKYDKALVEESLNLKKLYESIVSCEEDDCDKTKKTAKEFVQEKDSDDKEDLSVMDAEDLFDIKESKKDDCGKDGKCDGDSCDKNGKDNCDEGDDSKKMKSPSEF